jgi:hypothetical protein
MLELKYSGEAHFRARGQRRFTRNARISKSRQYCRSIMRPALPKGKTDFSLPLSLSLFFRARPRRVVRPTEAEVLRVILFKIVPPSSLELERNLSVIFPRAPCEREHAKERRSERDRAESALPANSPRVHFSSRSSEDSAAKTALHGHPPALIRIGYNDVSASVNARGPAIDLAGVSIIAD